MVARGARAAASPAEVAREVDVLFTCLLTPAQSEAIFLGDNGAIHAAKAHGVRLLLPTIAQQMYQEASGLGHAQKDVASVVLPMEAIAGIEVKPK